MRELSLLNLINRVDELPEVPQIAFRAIQLLNNPDTNVNSLAEVIASDQALTAKVLRLCNSVYYGLSRSVTTVSEAVMIVGFSSVKSLVLMITTQSTMNKGLLGYKIGPGEFWEHSLATAETTRFLAKHIAHEKPEECFIAGLIHDIGKMVLNQYALPEVYRATNLSQKEHLPIHLAEQQILGFDHAEVGAALAERWNFPAILVESLRLHHSLAEASQSPLDNPLPVLVSLSNLIADHLHAPSAQLSQEIVKHQELLQNTLKLSGEEIQNLLPSIQRCVRETNALVVSLE